MRWVFRICLGLLSLMTTDLAYADSPVKIAPPLAMEGQLYEFIMLGPDGILVLRERGTGEIVKFNISGRKVSAGANDILPQQKAAASDASI